MKELETKQENLQDIINFVRMQHEPYQEHIQKTIYEGFKTIVDGSRGYYKEEYAIVESIYSKQQQKKFTSVIDDIFTMMEQIADTIQNCLPAERLHEVLKDLVEAVNI